LHLLSPEDLDEQRDKHGRTALMLYLSSHHCSIGSMLRFWDGADWKIRDAMGNTTLHHAMISSKQRYETLSIPKSEGADASAVNNLGETALHVWVKKNPIFDTAIWGKTEEETYKILKGLLRCGVNFKARTKRGNTFIHTLLNVNRYILNQANAIGLLKCLVHCRLKKGAGKFFDEANNKGETAILLAVKRGFSKVLEFLIRYGANPDIRDKAGRGVFHYLKKTPVNSIKSTPTTRRVLLEYGITPQKTSKELLEARKNMEPVFRGERGPRWLTTAGKRDKRKANQQQKTVAYIPQLADYLSVEEVIW